MKAFRFSLQAILTLREQREQEARRHYARKLQAVESAQRSLAVTGRELQHLAEEHQFRLRHGAQSQDLRYLDIYRHTLNDRLTRLQQELAAARKAAERAWLALVQATQDRQALDHYRQKRRRAYDYAVARDAQRLLDDFAARAPTLAGAWRQPADPGNLIPDVGTDVRRRRTPGAVPLASSRRRLPSVRVSGDPGYVPSP